MTAFIGSATAPLEPEHVDSHRRHPAPGTVFLGAFVGIASGAGSRITIVIFVVAVLIMWTWFTSFALHLLRVSR